LNVNHDNGFVTKKPLQNGICSGGCSIRYKIAKECVFLQYCLQYDTRIPIEAVAAISCFTFPDVLIYCSKF